MIVLHIALILVGVTGLTFQTLATAIREDYPTRVREAGITVGCYAASFVGIWFWIAASADIRWQNVIEIVAVVAFALLTFNHVAERYGHTLRHRLNQALDG